MNPTRKLLIASIVLLSILGLRASVNFSAIFASARASGISPFSSGRIIGAFIGAAIWFLLALVQWRKDGGWALGVGIYAVFVLVIQALLFALALRSGRIALDLSGALSFFGFSVLCLGGLAVVNFKLNAARKEKKA